MSGVADSEATRLLRERPLDTFTSPQCTVSIWRPGPTLLVTRVVGVLTEGGAVAIEAAVRRQVAQDGRHLAFHDWEEMEDYQPSARTRLTTLGVTTLNALEAAHFLLRSRVVTFGVQIASVIVKNLKVHPSRVDFERALTVALSVRGREATPAPVKRRPSFTGALEIERMSAEPQPPGEPELGAKR